MLPCGSAVGRHATIHASAWPSYSAPVRRGHCDPQGRHLPGLTYRDVSPCRCPASRGARARRSRPPPGCAVHRHGLGHGRGAPEGRSPPVTRAGHAWCETTCFGRWDQHALQAYIPRENGSSHKRLGARRRLKAEKTRGAGQQVFAAPRGRGADHGAARGGHGMVPCVGTPAWDTRGVRTTVFCWSPRKG
jgi:hypothetical protein